MDHLAIWLYAGVGTVWTSLLAFKEIILFLDRRMFLNEIKDNFDIWVTPIPRDKRQWVKPYNVYTGYCTVSKENEDSIVQILKGRRAIKALFPTTKDSEIYLMPEKDKVTSWEGIVILSFPIVMDIVALEKKPIMMVDSDNLAFLKEVNYG